MHIIELQATFSLFLEVPILISILFQIGLLVLIIGKWVSNEAEINTKMLDLGKLYKGRPISDVLDLSNLV